MSKEHATFSRSRHSAFIKSPHSFRVTIAPLVCPRIDVQYSGYDVTWLCHRWDNKYCSSVMGGYVICSYKERWIADPWSGSDLWPSESWSYPACYWKFSSVQRVSSFDATGPLCEKRPATGTINIVIASSFNPDGSSVWSATADGSPFDSSFNLPSGGTEVTLVKRAWKGGCAPYIKTEYTLIAEPIIQTLTLTVKR